VDQVSATNERFEYGVSQEEAHGDRWAARIRAEHEALGPACPCGNGGVMTTTYSSEAEQGVREAVEGTWGRYGFTLEVTQAIVEGLLTDADPTWWAQDIGASTKVSFTEAGRALARERGWFVACKCPPCDREVGTVGRDLRYKGWCSGCHSSGSQYAFYPDDTGALVECGSHFKSRTRG
jgi:hypothetical protein